MNANGPSTGSFEPEGKTAPLPFCPPRALEPTALKGRLVLMIKKKPLRPHEEEGESPGLKERKTFDTGRLTKDSDLSGMKVTLLGKES